MTVGHDYAEIYVQRPREQLIELLAQQLDFATDDQAVAPTLRSDEFEIELRRNPDAGHDPEHFTAYDTIIEVATLDGSENPSIVALIDRTVSILRSAGHPAVPVADFEAELSTAKPGRDDGSSG